MKSRPYCLVSGNIAVGLQHFPVRTRSVSQNSCKTAPANRGVQNVADSHFSDPFSIRKFQVLFKTGPCCSGTSPITPVVQNNCAWLCSRHQISQTESNIPLRCLLLVLGDAGWGGGGWGGTSVRLLWLSGRYLLSGLCSSAFRFGSDAHCYCQAEARLR